MIPSHSTLQVTGGGTGGASGVPASASAIFTTIQVLHQTGAGNITVYPGGTRPTSAYDYPTTNAMAFGIEAALSSSSTFYIYNGGDSSIDLVADVVGYFTSTNSSGAFTPWQTRSYDSRVSNTPLAANGIASVQVAGMNGVPAPGEGVTSVAIDIQGIEPAGGNNSFLRAWAGNNTEPEPTAVGSLDLVAGATRGTLAFIEVGNDGTIKIRNASNVSIDIVLDVEGWFAQTNNVPPPATGPICNLAGQRRGSQPIKHSLSDRTQMMFNSTNGNLGLTGTLLHLTGIQQDVSISWRYNSRNDARPTLSVGRYEDALRPWSNGDFTYVAPDGGCYRFTQNSDGTSWSAPAGINAKLNSPSAGRMTLRFDPGGVKNTYDLTGGVWNLTKSEDKNNTNPNTVSYTYANGYLSSITDTQGRVINLAYNDTHNASQPSTITDTSLNRTITLAYSGPSGALSSITDAANDTTTFTYDTTGLTSLTDGEGRQTTFAYGADSKLTNWTFGATSSASAAWTAAYTTDTTTVITDPDNHAASYQFSNGNVTRITDGNQHYTQSSWDSHDNLMSQTNGSADTTTYGYGNGTGNPNNLVSKATSPNSSSGGSNSGGASQSLTYPSASQGSQVDNEATASTDGQSNKTALTWDASTNQLKSSATTSAGGTSVGGNHSANYQGDTPEHTDCGAKQGEMCSSTSGNGNKTNYGYDSAGNLIAISPPAPLGNKTYTYDAAGRVTSQGDGRGNTAYLSYDGDDRVTQVSYSASSCPTATCVTYSYDQSGNKTGRVDASGTTTFVYDALNRLTAKKLGGTTISSTTYDGVGNMLTYTDGYGTTAYTYDAGNRVITLAEPGGSCPPTPNSPNSTACTSFGYDSSDRRTSTSYPTGQTVSTDYDHAGRIKSIKAKKHDGTVIVERDYTYKANGSNDAGLVDTMKDENNNTTTYANYDGKNRLTSVTGTDAGSWDYDNDGNRTKNTTGSTTTYSAYNNADELCWSSTTNASGCSNAPTGASTYSSDTTGNQLTDSTTAGLVTNTDNVFNQTTATTVGSTATSFAYADTTNTERVSAGNTTYSNGISGVDSQTAGATTYFVRDPSGTPIAMRVGGASYYYTTDAIGSILLLTDANQNAVASYKYGPWGNQTSSTGTMATTNPYRYAGGYFDPQTGYTKFGARYYNPATGRFSQPDPHSTWGNYQYASNNPISKTDPTGNDWFDTTLDVVGTVASVAAAVPSPIQPVAAALAVGTSAGKAIYDCDGGGTDSCGESAAGAVASGATFGIGEGLESAGYHWAATGLAGGGAVNGLLQWSNDG